MMSLSHFTQQGDQSFACVHTCVVEESGPLLQCTVINIMLQKSSPTPKFCFYLIKPSSLSRDDRRWGGSPSAVTFEKEVAPILDPVTQAGQILPGVAWMGTVGGCDPPWGA